MESASSLEETQRWENTPRRITFLNSHGLTLMKKTERPMISGRKIGPGFLYETENIDLVEPVPS